jgi:hypothetical protein
MLPIRLLYPTCRLSLCWGHFRIGLRINRSVICLLLQSAIGHRGEKRCRRTSSAGSVMRALLGRVFAVLYPAFCSVTASGPVRRPAAARSSASTALPCGLRFPSKSCSESTPKRFLRSLHKCRASALGSRAHSHPSTQRPRAGTPGSRLAPPGVTRA